MGPAGSWLAIAGGLLAGVGAFLPWFTASIPSSWTLDRNGFQLGQGSSFSTDGVMIVFLGIATITIGIVGLTRPSMPWFLQIVTGTMIILLACSDLADIVRLVHRTSAVATASIGFGLYVVMAGGAVAVLAGLVFRSRRTISAS